MGTVGRAEMGSGSQVAQWYAGRSILLTGATGFLGLAIVEKLLRCCPDIATIYMLVRPKRGKSPRERLEAYTSNVAFSKLRAERPDFARHLSVVAADLSSPDFRLEEQDMAALRRDVSVVFHCAASVRFDLSLRDAVNSNVVGTKHVLQLAEQLPHLQVFMYISTSFCHSDHKVIEEKLYPAKLDPEKIMDVVSWMDDELLGIITPKLLGKLPNTYALTKNMTEELVARYSDRLPIVIARPSIVVSAWKEPMEGWVANMNGPLGIGVATGKGVMRVVSIDVDIASDSIPVDCTANAIIAVAWHFAGTRLPSPYVCNVTNGQQKHVTWATIIDTLTGMIQTEIPLMPFLWYPSPIFTTSVVWYTICHFFLEVLPAHILDFVILLCGRKPFLVNINNRLQTANTMLRYYMVHEWTFINKNLMSLYESMDPQDKETFYFNFAEMDTHNYLRNAVIGVKVYLLNESMDDLQGNLRHMRRMYWLHNIVRAVFYGLLLWFLYSWSQPALEAIQTAVAYLTNLLDGAPIITEEAVEVPVAYNVLPQDVVDVTNSGHLS